MGLSGAAREAERREANTFRCPAAAFLKFLFFFQNGNSVFSPIIKATHVHYKKKKIEQD